MSQVNFGLRRAERAAQLQRPAKLTYADKEIPCTPGNLDFFFQLRGDGGGFMSQQTMYVKILRIDIPAELAALPEPFHSGHKVTITNLDLESPGYGEVFDLVVGKNNITTSQMVMLNLASLNG